MREFTIEVDGAERNMRTNTVALLASTLGTGLLGLVFWAMVARLFPPEEVGLAAALINSAMMIATLSLLGIDTLYERFLPVSGTRAGGLLNRGHLVVAGIAMVAGAGMVAFGPRDPMFQSGWAMVSYPFVVMIFALFIVQDKACAGAGVARWAAAKNMGHAVAKLLALLALAFYSAFAVSIVFAWTATAAIGLICTYFALQKRVGSNPHYRAEPNLPPSGKVWSFLAPSIGITALSTIGPLVVPLIVITTLNAEANAYFAVTWAIIAAVYLLLHMVVSPFVAEAVANPDRLASLAKRMVQMQCLVAMLASLGLVTVGPVLLGLAGDEYRAQGQGLLHLAAVFIPLSAVGAVYEGLARVGNRLWPYLAVQGMVTTVIIVGSLLTTPSIGLNGVGWSFLAAEALAAVILIGPTVTWMRRAARGNASASVPTIDATGVVT